MAFAQDAGFHRATVFGSGKAAIEEVLGGKASPQQALDNAAADVTKLITDYNRTVK